MKCRRVLFTWWSNNWWQIYKTSLLYHKHVTPITHKQKQEMKPHPFMHRPAWAPTLLNSDCKYAQHLCIVFSVFHREFQIQWLVSILFWLVGGQMFWPNGVSHATPFFVSYLYLQIRTPQIFVYWYGKYRKRVFTNCFGSWMYFIPFSDDGIII